MGDNRKAMYEGWRKNGAHSRQWEAICQDFLKQAFKVARGPVMPCPCLDCKNNTYKTRHVMEEHLCKFGFMPDYLVWHMHGEKAHPRISEPAQQNRDGMMMDMLNDLAMGVEFGPEENNEPPPDVQEFYRLLEAGGEKLHDHTENTVLDTVSRLMAIKSDHNISNRCFNDIAKLVSDVIPSDHKLPKNLYYAKKMMAGLGMKYEKIDVCPSNCMLFWREDDKLKTCRHCGKSRYIQVKNEEGENVDTTVAAKQLRYMPIIPRLKRLFLSMKIAKSMRWHKERRCGGQGEDVMAHPADGDAWKALDEFDPEFARDPRSVCLGLATDGFTPFSTSASPYSCWPVFIMPYNLPPEMVLKDEFVFLALVIPGPEHPGKNLNVFLRPLIEELKQLWKAVKACDSYAKKEFNLHVTYLWSVQDLLAYGNFAGWFVNGRLQCPICMDDSDAYRLKNGGKYTFFDCTQRELPPRHKLRQSTTAFRKGVKVSKLPSKRKTAKEIMAWHRCLKVDPSTKKFDGYGTLHNWTHISLLWELPYAEALMLPHNIDLMHQERNVAESIISMVFDVTEKSKDNIKARKDLALLCDRPNLEVRLNEKGKECRPRAEYCPKPEERKQIFEWLKALKFPDRYAANLKRAVNLKTGKLTGLKSHDYHIIMERLLPVMFRGYFKDDLWRLLAELSYFYRHICAKTVSMSLMEKFVRKIPVHVCKLEKVFPPGFMNVMQHLLIHLPWEALVGGPVQCRWMYPIERQLKKLRSTVRNKARVEGCIAEAFALKEMSHFTKKYFNKADAANQSKRVAVADVGPQSDLKIFKSQGTTSGPSTVHHLNESELNSFLLYMFSNMTEMNKYFEYVIS
ncbi:hypothetical protein U9M48_011283 [Paspalum notatum var. saurae]|uniref:Transposase-associated domain-containing protein n=1 Tax=Paspalum notatum var. saurae TaxID=547442 RepID=A0AAQ3SWZ1_PASNO